MRTRRAFSLLEVMIALAILVVCVVILVDSQSTSAQMTSEAQKMLIGTNLAQEKTAEVMLLVEEEGFTDTDKCDSGDFASFGDDELDLEFGDALDVYHWEYCVSEIDIALAGDIVSMAQGLAGDGAIAGTPLPSDAAGGGGGLPGGLDLAMFGLSPEVMSQMLSRYIREVRVRVWWGEDGKKSKESGDEVIVVTHAFNPSGAMRQMETDPTGGS